MKFWRYIRRSVTFLSGCISLFVLQEIRSFFSPAPPAQHVNPTAFVYSRDFGRVAALESTNWTKRPLRPEKRVSGFSLNDSANKSTGFTATYIRTVFCNTHHQTAVFQTPAVLLEPNDRFLEQKKLMVLVISSLVHSDFRQAVRQTWGNVTLSGVGVIFVIGSHWDQFWTARIAAEHSTHGDILQVNKPDTYRNLPEKILSAFRWVTESVRDVTHVVKADDDVYLHLPNILSVIEYLKDDVIVGAYNPHSIVSRNIHDEWGVSKETYLPAYFPPYVSGGSYLMSVRATRKLLQSVPICRTLHIEDVFITGILAMSARIGHQSHPGFSFWASPKAQQCDFVNGRVNSVNMAVTQLYVLHQLQQNGAQCNVHL